MTNHTVRGYVLAGGESSRMQRLGLPRDKALLVLGGQTLLERALEALSKICSEPQILCGGEDRCKRLQQFGSTVSDQVSLAGPLGGLHAALADARQHGAAWVLVTPVDLPWMPASLLSTFVQTALDSSAVVSCLRAAGTAQPLPVLLNVTAEPMLLQALQTGHRKLRPVLEHVGTQCGDRSGVRFIDVDSCGLPVSAAEICFRNLNTPEDFENAQQDETLRTVVHQSKHGG